MLLTSSLLERLRNNMLVVEVWDKQTTADGDRLLGIVKLPLHQFYMSFRDRKIANSLLESQVRLQANSLLKSQVRFSDRKMYLQLVSVPLIMYLLCVPVPGDHVLAVCFSTR